MGLAQSACSWRDQGKWLSCFCTRVNDSISNRVCFPLICVGFLKMKCQIITAGCFGIWTGHSGRVAGRDLEKQSSIEHNPALPCHGPLSGGGLLFSILMLMCCCVYSSWQDVRFSSQRRRTATLPTYIPDTSLAGKRWTSIYQLSPSSLSS